MNAFTITPFSKAASGEVRLPGSKSITNRALILAALSSNCVEIHNGLISEDTLIMIDALKILGFSIRLDALNSKITVQGLSGKIPRNFGTFNVGNAGTVARFLPAILCLHPSGTYHLDGSAEMRKRPMKPLLDALESIGAATITYHENTGYFPFTIKTRGVHGGEILLDASSSSQLLSSLLMIAPLSTNVLSINLATKVVSWPFVEMTLKMMETFGQKALPTLRNQKFLFTQSNAYKLPSQHYWVEPDATAASYFLALVLILGGQLKIPDLSLNHSIQGDLHFGRILEISGLKMDQSDNALTIQRGFCPSLCGITADFTHYSDTFLTLAAIAPLLKSPTHIGGIGHTRLQETDRIGAVTTELRRLNQGVIENPNSITIIPRRLRPTSINTYNDHRMAMSFAILGSYDLTKIGIPWLSINHPSCCSKTFPNFFNTLNGIRNAQSNTPTSCTINNSL